MTRPNKKRAKALRQQRLVDRAFAEMDTWLCVECVLVRCESCGLEQTTVACEKTIRGCVVCGHEIAVSA